MRRAAAGASSLDRGSAVRRDFGEWTPDVVGLDSPLIDVENAIPYAGHYRQMRDLVPISSALPDAPVAGISTSVINGVTETYAATQTSLYQLVTNTWTDRSGAVYLTENPGVWAFAQYRDRVLACSYNNLVQQKQIANPVNFADIADSPRGRVMGVVRQFVMVGDINDPTDGLVPERVRWGAIDDPLSFPLPGTAGAIAVQADEQNLKAEYGAVRGIFGTTVGIILQERAVVRAEYVGAPLVFRFDDVDTTNGLSVRGAAVQVGRKVYYLSEDGFYVTDGNGESTPIGYAKVDQWFFTNLNADKLDQVRAVRDPFNKVIFWTFPSLASDTNDSVLLYNYAENKWARGNINASFAMFSRSAGYTLEELDSFGDLDTLEESLDSQFWQGGGSVPSLFTADYELGSLSGDPLVATFQTGEFSMDGRRFYITGVRPLVTSGSAQIQLSTRKTLNDARVWGPLRSPTASTGVADFRSSAHFQTARVIVTGGFEKAVGIDTIEVADDGAR